MGLCVHIVWNMYITSNLDRQILLMEFVMICVEYGIQYVNTLHSRNLTWNRNITNQKRKHI